MKNIKWLLVLFLMLSLTFAFACGEKQPEKDEPVVEQPGEDNPGEDNPGEDNPGEDKPSEDDKKG